MGEDNPVVLGKIYCVPVQNGSKDAQSGGKVGGVVVQLMVAAQPARSILKSLVNLKVKQPVVLLAVAVITPGELVPENCPNNGELGELPS